MPDIGKLTELQQWCHYAAEQWLAECEKQGLSFRVTEVYRTQERQDKLYAQGRETPGKIVTWTRTSMHTQRLAADIVAVKGSYAQIEAVAKLFGIFRPPELVKLGDKGHFDFSRAHLPPVTVDPVARLKGLVRRLAVTVDPYLKEELTKLIDRLRKRLSTK